MAQAVAIGLHGELCSLDVGTVNGERFAVMAGAGIDAQIMGSVDTVDKRRLGRFAYFGSGVAAMRSGRRQMKINVDGGLWFDGKASCVLFGNVGTLTGGLRILPDAPPDGGLLEIGVVTAQRLLDWLRFLTRVGSQNPDKSPMVTMTHGRRFSVPLERPLRYELDGGRAGRPASCASACSRRPSASVCRSRLLLRTLSPIRNRFTWRANAVHVNGP